MNICKWGPLWYIIVGVRQRRCRSPFDFIFPLLQNEFSFNVHYLAFSLSFCRPPFSLCLLLLPFSPFLPFASLSSLFLLVCLSFFFFFLVPVLFQLRLGDFLLLFCLFQFPLPSVLSVLFFLLFVLTFLRVFSTFPKLRINFFHIFPLSFLSSLSRLPSYFFLFHSPFHFFPSFSSPQSSLPHLFFPFLSIHLVRFPVLFPLPSLHQFQLPTPLRLPHFTKEEQQLSLFTVARHPSRSRFASVWCHGRGNPAGNVRGRRWMGGSHYAGVRVWDKYVHTLIHMHTFMHT